MSLRAIGAEPTESEAGGWLQPPELIRPAAGIKPGLSTTYLASLLIDQTATTKTAMAKA